MRFTCVFLTLFWIGSPGSPVAGGTVSASGTIESVCANCRTVTVYRNTRTRDKSGTFKLSDDAAISINDEESDLDALVAGDKVTLTYDKATKRIVKVEGSKFAPAAKAPDHAADEKSPAKSARAPAKRPASPKLDARFFSKKFAAKTAYNAKTGELTLAYSFPSKVQLKDFALKGQDVVAQGGTLWIGPGDSLEHVAKFSELKVSGTFTIKNVPSAQNTALLRTSSGVACVCDDFNGDLLKLRYGDRRIAEKNCGRGSIQNLPVPIVFAVTDRKTLLHATVLKEGLGQFEIGDNVESGSPGRVELLGGKGGMEVRSLVISGKPDENWLKELLGETEETPSQGLALHRQEEKHWTGWVSLAANVEEFKRYWVPGDDRGNFFFDPDQKSIVIDSPWLLGKITSDTSWSEFYFEAAVEQLSFGNFDMKIKGSTFKLGDALAKASPGVEVRVKYDTTTKTATALVADKPVSRATILDDNWMKTFQCEFNSGGGQNAKLKLRNLRLLPASSTRSAIE